MTQTVFMFSGQGSQYFQMGRALYDRDETFRGWMERLDEIARASGIAVVEQLYADTRKKGEPFDRTLLTHPAIFMVEYSLAQTLIERGIHPDVVLGASLGSFAAAAVAGFLDVNDAMKAVVHQAQAMEECCTPGGMTAILADPALFEEEFLSRRCELAAVHFSGHFVVSGRNDDLQYAEGALKARNVSHQRLPVSFAFHSQWMDGARAPFEAFMANVRRTSGRIPLACCDETAMLDSLHDGYFWDVVRRPIRFHAMTARLEQDGPKRYIDVGPAGTLATFLKYGLPSNTKSTVHSILTPFGRDVQNLAALTN